jgi:phage-related protein
MYRNSQFPKLLAMEYNMMTEVNSIIEYKAMNLNTVKHVTSEARPSFSNMIIGLIFGTFDVNGAAIDASASDKERPTSAVLSALQSFAPSPHIPIMSLVFS